MKRKNRADEQLQVEEPQRSLVLESTPSGEQDSGRSTQAQSQAYKSSSDRHCLQSEERAASRNGNLKSEVSMANISEIDYEHTTVTAAAAAAVAAARAACLPLDHEIDSSHSIPMPEIEPSRYSDYLAQETPFTSLTYDTARQTFPSDESDDDLGELLGPLPNSSSPRIHDDKRKVQIRNGSFACRCCKKPRRFDSQEKLEIVKTDFHGSRQHRSSKHYSCIYCHNRFKNKNEAERHQNSLHRRLHSWSCGPLAADFTKAFFPSSIPRPHISAPDIAIPYSQAQKLAASDICGFCGQEFKNHPEPDWQDRQRHLVEGHKLGECKETKKFFRADHFRQHLKHSHSGQNGKHTNHLEGVCVREESPAVPLDRLPSSNASNSHSASATSPNPPPDQDRMASTREHSNSDQRDDHDPPQPSSFPASTFPPSTQSFDLKNFLPSAPTANMGDLDDLDELGMDATLPGGGISGSTRDCRGLENPSAHLHQNSETFLDNLPHNAADSEPPFSKNTKSPKRRGKAPRRRYSKRARKAPPAQQESSQIDVHNIDPNIGQSESHVEIQAGLAKLATLMQSGHKNLEAMSQLS